MTIHRLHASGLALVTVFVALAPAQSVPGAPPARPRLLFRAQDIPVLAAKVVAPGTFSSQMWGSMSTSAVWQCGVTSGACPGGSQDHWRVYRSFRAMTELAARYAILGDAAAGANAKALLLGGAYNALSYTSPSAAFPPSLASYPCAIAATYDMIRPLLTPAERALVIAEIESWVQPLESAVVLGIPLAGYGGATNNYTFALAAGIVVSLLGVWGESALPDIPQRVATWCAYLRTGYLDAISPDGSVDESYGYAHYGPLYSLQAAVAAENCGFGDQLAGTNVLRTPGWFAASLMGDSFPWSGDSSPTHRGVQFDPVLFAVVGRTGDACALHGLQRILAVRPIDPNHSTFAWSPFLTAALHYPESLTPVAPAVASAVFGDNLNIAPAGWAMWNASNNHPAAGEGCQAFLHNGPSAAAAPFSVFYNIRDEWANHGHEDDGHVGLAALGTHLLLDRGYAVNPGGNPINPSEGAQHDEHNIVTVAGGQPFGQVNHFNPPLPDGRFRGRRLASFLSPVFDYVRGDHAFAWMMNRAERTVALVKDPANPYAIVLDHVEKGPGTFTYEQRWNGASAATGAGTAQNPVIVSGGSASLRTTYLSPSSVTVVPGAQTTLSSSGITFFPNKVTRTAAGAVTFLGVNHVQPLTSSAPLSQPAPGTVGGVLTWGPRVDRILAATSAGGASDAAASSDARFVWVRRDQGIVTSYALAGGTQLGFQGMSLLSSSVPVDLAVSGGRVDIARVAPPSSGPALPSILLHLPAPPAEVLLDGLPVAYAVVGNVLGIGLSFPATSPVSPNVTNDRFYTFSEPVPLDAWEGPGLVRSLDGRITAAPQSGIAGFSPRGDSGWSGPVAVAWDVQIPGGPSAGWAGGLDLGTAPGAFDVLRIGFFGAASGVYVLAYNSLGPPVFFAAAPVGSEASVRIVMNCGAAAGVASFTDRLGRPLGSLAVPAAPAPLHLRFGATSAILFDNVAVFDAEEDGVTPQGIAVWVLPSGNLGMAFHAPFVLGGSGVGFQLNGLPVPPPIVAAWFGASWMTEFLLAPAIVAPGFNPLLMRELALESLVPAVPPAPGVVYGVRYVAASGAILAADAWFTP